ncbi:uncharacterized protein LOC127699443 isoform X3 [Mytilus californianus]|uniref:uncharacterized protein LOC127699443 isoform X3 n=1 Tax=Mytilus californianus TaxID=6549 RepID=UPI0022464511|nr:uncharacterized protein LOC127699443 isoform X3 [Mytilus californianus]
MKFPRLLTQKRDPLARQKIRYILNQPVHKRAKVVRFSLPQINDPQKNKQSPDDIIPLPEKTRRFEVKKFETLDNVHYEKREEETIRLRWTSRLEKEAENISKVFNRSDTSKEDVLKLPKLVHLHNKDRNCRNSCNVCEASRIISASPVDKVFREHREHGISCKCTVCETVNKIRAMQSPSPSESELDTGRLLSQMQINQQLNLLRNTGSLTPIQMYSHRMIRFKLMQNHRRQTLPIRLQPTSSSSTPTVPYSTTDILYGNEVRNSPQLDEIRQNSFIEYSKDKDRLSSNNLVDFNNRRPASKSGTRKSLSIEKVNFNKESDDNLRPILPSPGKNGNQYRPNGLRNGLLKGDPLYGSRGGRESDDLIAMGTIWSPNTGAQKNSGSNSANGIQNVTGKSVSMVASNSSTTVARKNVKPIMVQNSSSHGRSNFKEVEPRYTDPVIGAQPSFQQRLMELSALESETIRYEKSKKVKKKVRDRDS